MSRKKRICFICAWIGIIVLFIFIVLLLQAYQKADAGLSRRDALDIVYEQEYANEPYLIDVSFYETDDVIGYKWLTESNMSDPMYLTQRYSTQTSQGDVYYFVTLGRDLYGSTGVFIRTEIYNEYAVNMNTGEIIEIRDYHEDGSWDYSQEYREKILEEDGCDEPVQQQMQEGVKRDKQYTIYINNDGTYLYEIYNLEGSVVWRDILYDEPEIQLYDSRYIEVQWRCGTGVWMDIYYDLKTCFITQPIECARYLDNGVVAIVVDGEKRGLHLWNPFSYSDFSQDIDIDFNTEMANPSDCIIQLTKNEEREFHIEYWNEAGEKATKKIFVEMQNPKLSIEDREVLSKISGEWIITEYVGRSVPFHEENGALETKSEDIDEELIDSYIDCRIVINEENIQTIFPPTELGYYYALMTDLFAIYRVPADLDLYPPFYCAEIKTEGLNDSVDMIIDSKGRAVITVKGVFWELERVGHREHGNSFSGNKAKEEYDIFIEQIDHSVISDSGELIAQVYYDKPILLGEDKVAEKINCYFEEEFHNWLEGESRFNFFRENVLNSFYDDVEEMRKAVGEEILVQQPFVYTVDTEVMLHSDKFLSVLYLVKYQTSGPNSVYYFGSTFDMKTGEVVPIDTIVKTDANSLRDLIVEFIKEKEYIFYSSEHLEQAISTYEERVDSGDELSTLEFFYDGVSIYIILNDDIFANSGCVIKWNGKHGSEAGCSLISYAIEENKLKIMEY